MKRRIKKNTSNKNTGHMLTKAVRLALGAACVVPLIAGQAYAAEEPAKTKLDKVKVLGSHIPRAEVEGISPVITIQREDIERVGITTVSELLRALTSNSAGSFDDKFTNSFAPGSSGVSLRGLGQNATLVLLNGRRVANYGFAQNITAAFVDLNSIPLAAIEKVEILKDGASALYGSDAIAGVINVILRKDYQGADFTVGYGVSGQGDGNETTLSMVYGTGSGKHNATFVLDYLKREAIWLRDRTFSASADHSSQGGDNNGYDFRSSAFPVANVRATTGAWIGWNGRFDYNPYITAVPETERLGGLISYNQEINNDLSFFGQVSLNKIKTHQEAAPTPLFGDVEGVVISASQPFNTYGQDVYVRWRMLEAGSRISDLETDASRLVAGLEGVFGKWDWEAAAVHSRSETTATETNYVNRLALITGINNGSINPFGTAPNDPAAMAGIKANTWRKGESQMDSADFRMSGDVAQLKHGPVAMAFGAEYRHEKLRDTSDPLSLTGQIIGSGGTASDGSRNLTSLFVEANVPVTDTVEMQLAARHEQYSDFGNTTNPKIAVRIQPNENLMFRASWGTGFRAPSLVELYMGASESYPFLIDTTRCSITGTSEDCGGSQYKTVFSGNPDLDPEESENIYLGAVWEAHPGLTFGLDFWRFEHTDIIDADTQYILDNESAFPGRVVRSGPSFPGDPGDILQINDGFENIAKQKTHGIDLDIRYSTDLPDDKGKLSFGHVLTYVMSFEREGVPGTGMDELAGTYGYPEVRHVSTVSWEKGDHVASFTANFIGEYEDYYTDYNDDIVKVDSDLTFDIQYVYSGWKVGKVTFGIKNLTDEDPPFANSEIEGYDFATANPRGRFFYARFNKSI